MMFNLEFSFAPIGSLSDYSPIEEFDDILPHLAEPECEPHPATTEQQHDPNSTWPSTHPYPLLNNPYYDLYNTKIPSTPIDLATQTIESMASAPPNIDFGNPVIFYDSHPEEQEGYLYSYYSSLKATLAVAWTGDVPKPLLPGHLRIVWWTRDGTKGQKDYELHEHRLVKDNFHALLHLPEIRRCLVTGFSGQNPYAMESGNANIWESTMDRKLREDQQSAKYWASKEAQGKTDERGVFDVDSVIESVVKKNEEAEKERLANIQKEDV